MSEKSEIIDAWLTKEEIKHMREGLKRISKQLKEISKKLDSYAELVPHEEEVEKSFRKKMGLEKEGK